MVQLVGARHGAMAQIAHTLRENFEDEWKEFIDPDLYLPLPPTDAYYFRGTNPDNVRKNQQVAVFIFPPSDGSETTVSQKRTSSPDGNKEMLSFRVHVLLMFKPGLYDPEDPFVDSYGNELTHQQLMYFRAETYTDLMDWIIRRHAENENEILRIKKVDSSPSLDVPEEEGSIIGLSFLTYEVTQDRLVPNRKF